MTDQARDAIDALVDWQLAGKPDNTHKCQACRAKWTGQPHICPECHYHQARP